jgi:hypothetical protein
MPRGINGEVVVDATAVTHCRRWVDAFFRTRGKWKAKGEMGEGFRRLIGW